MQANCTICDEEFRPDNIYSTPCGHTYHQDCIAEWLNTSESCPECRGLVTKESLLRLHFNVPDEKSLDARKDESMLDLCLLLSEKQEELKKITTEKEAIENEIQIILFSMKLQLKDKPDTGNVAGQSGQGSQSQASSSDGAGTSQNGDAGNGRSPQHAAAYMQNQEPLTEEMLAAANLGEQKQMLGERLYPLVLSWFPDYAKKVTGMLLEMDNAELLHLLAHRDELEVKTNEAVGVLLEHLAKQAQGRNGGRVAGGPREANRHVNENFGPGPNRYASGSGRILPNNHLAHAHQPHQANIVCLQKRMLGEHLYPFVQAMYPDIAGKVTGMLLEMDNSELLHLLVHHDALAAKVEEAVAVLEAYHAQQANAQGGCSGSGAGAPCEGSHHARRKPLRCCRHVRRSGPPRK